MNTQTLVCQQCSRDYLSREKDSKYCSFCSIKTPVQKLYRSKVTGKLTDRKTGRSLNPPKEIHSSFVQIELEVVCGGSEADQFELRNIRVNARKSQYSAPHFQTSRSPVYFDLAQFVECAALPYVLDQVILETISGEVAQLRSTRLAQLVQLPPKHLAQLVHLTQKQLEQLVQLTQKQGKEAKKQ